MKHHSVFGNRKHLHQQGFSLVELLVTLVVGMLVISAAVSVTIASNRMFRVDRARTRMNQNLRAASDLVGADVRTAGSAVSGAVSGDGEAGLQPIIVRNGNELEIRRSVLPISLPVCDSVSGSQKALKVSNPSEYDDEECDGARRDIDGDGTPEDLEEWIAHRTDPDKSPDGTVLVYIWPSDDGNENGEFFIYDDEDTSQQQIHKASGSWEHSYDWEDEDEPKPRLYIMEQRRYQLNEGVLELIINGDEENPLRLVNNITDFQVRVITKDGEFEDFGSADDHLFSDIQGIEINVSAEEQVTPDQLVTRELNNRFFPRNAINF